MVDVSEFLESEMGQSESEAQSDTLAAFLQDLSSHDHNDGTSLPGKTNSSKEGGALQYICNRLFTP